MVIKLNDTVKILPESYLKNPYKNYRFITDEEIWRSGVCQIGDLCYVKLPGDEKHSWMKYGVKKDFCDIYWQKKLDQNNRDYFVEYLRKNWSFDEISVMGCKSPSRSVILNKRKHEKL